MAAGYGNELQTQALQWIQTQLGNTAEITGVKPLTGGTSSMLFELAVEENGVSLSYVLRLFHKIDWLEKEPDLAKHEAESLQFAEQAGHPVPHLLAYDETNEENGLPEVLMTKMSRAVILQQSNDEKSLDGLAAALAKLHQTKAEGFTYEYFSYNNALLLEKQTWSKRQNPWMRAFYT